MSKALYIAFDDAGRPAKFNANKPQWFAHCPETPLGFHDSLDAAQAEADKWEGGKVVAAIPVLVSKIGRTWRATIPGHTAYATRKGAALDLLYKTLRDEAG